jgi:hypothetical protein
MLFRNFKKNQIQGFVTLCFSLRYAETKAQAKHTEIAHKLTIFSCCCFANTTKTTTLKKSKQKP